MLLEQRRSLCIMFSRSELYDVIVLKIFFADETSLTEAINSQDTLKCSFEVSGNKTSFLAIMGAHPKEQDRVLVTGFGPFGVHKVNASWVAVQELEALGLDDPFVDLVVEEISVDYEYVKVGFYKRYIISAKVLRFCTGDASILSRSKKKTHFLILSKTILHFLQNKKNIWPLESF